MLQMPRNRIKLLAGRSVSRHSKHTYGPFARIHKFTPENQRSQLMLHFVAIIENRPYSCHIPNIQDHIY